MFKCLNSTSLNGECPMMFHSCHELGYTSCPHTEHTPAKEREAKKDLDARMELQDALEERELD